ncbi:hypothetical protein [Anaerotignum sp.]|uniref:hypothetical protein n=1 Tax=Anaerotignum sp. TaxID=2039241 RepID=UPI002714EA94|nr:hypothetical protein [Anaerotignum sp.]
MKKIDILEKAKSNLLVAGIILFVLGYIGQRIYYLTINNWIYSLAASLFFENLILSTLVVSFIIITSGIAGMQRGNPINYIKNHALKYIVLVLALGGVFLGLDCNFTSILMNGYISMVKYSMAFAGIGVIYLASLKS